MRIRIVALTNRGALRENNEDAVSVGNRIFNGEVGPVFQDLDRACPVVMVADGMGGHPHGATASQSALKAGLAAIRQPIDHLVIESAVSAANDSLYEMMKHRSELVGMGTTLVGVAFTDRNIIHFNVGDSRAYRHRPGELSLLSHDDVPIGSAGRELGRSSHLITQSLGGRSTRTRILPHVGLKPPLGLNETILLCSDGLTDMVSDGKLLQTLDDVAGLRERASALFELAMKAGGRDNVSLVIAQWA